MASNIPHLASFDDWWRHSSEPRPDTELAVQAFLSARYPDHQITRILASGCELLSYASAGLATATRHAEGLDAARFYVAPKGRMDQTPGKLRDDVKFGRWDYVWQAKDYILYQMQYLDHPLHRQCKRVFFILTLDTTDCDTDGHAAATDSLIIAASRWTNELHKEIYVYDSQMWSKDKKLYKDVKGSSWDDVILDPATKRGLVQDVMSFFDNRELYAALNVPWKRGVIFHGVPGNGKTISLKALINSLNKRHDSIPSLYVKSFDGCNGAKYSIREIFSHARIMAPCLLIFEDLDSLVVEKCRSYFLNEVDGLESNEGILMIGSTNHLDRLDPAITKRPSRFDRKYHFKLPTEGERLEYCRYWSRKFTGSSKVDFPDEMCHLIAAMTEGFSFAYLKELFITSLLELARGSTDEGEDTAIDDEGRAPPSDSTSVTDTVMVAHPDPDAEEAQGDSENPDAVAEEIAAAKAENAKGQVAGVGIDERFQDNTLLKIVSKQVKILLDEMDNTEEVGPKAGLGMADYQRMLMTMEKANLERGGSCSSSVCS